MGAAGSDMVPPDLVDLAQRVGLAGARVAKEHAFHHGFETKDDGSPVTRVDRAVESAMRAILAESVPDHAVTGEEHADTAAGSNEWTWVLDPIDGTRQFAAGLLNFAILVALCRAGKPVVGLIAHPFAHRVWLGVEGAGTTLNGMQLRTTNETQLGRVVGCLANPESFPGRYLGRLEAVASRSMWNVHDGGCIGYGALAEGRVGFCLNGPNLDVFDIAALVPVVEGAGGRITDWSGNRLDLNSRGAIMAAANGALHDKLLDILA